MEVISNHNNLNNNKIGDQLILKSKTKEIDKNFEKKEKIINNIIDKRNEIIIQQRKALAERQQRIHKVKTFINKGWEFNEEYINQKEYKMNFIHNNNHINIIKDINSLRNKRTIFINNISKLKDT